MEILNKLWEVITTENETIISIMSIFLLLIEMPLTMEFFLTILRIPATLNQKHIYLAITVPIGLLCIFLIPKPYSNIITMVITPFVIMTVFKVNFFKSLFAEFLPIVTITILEIIFSRILLFVFHIEYEINANIPLCRIAINSVIYLLIFASTKIIKHANFNLKLFDNISKNAKVTLFLNLVIALIVLFMQMYLIGYYNDNLPAFIVWINLLSLISYFVLSFYSIIKTMNLQKAEEDLEQEKQYNKTLQILHDNIRAFKHDFANIISGIGGYVETNDMKGLTKYYKQLLQDCNQVSNLGSLNPNSINSPAVYSVLANKYYKADNLGIKIDLETFIDFNNLYMGIYEFTRILGILMDNSIEATSECDNKYIHVEIRNDLNRNRQLLVIENTYKDKDINIEKIYEKGYSTKPHNTGLGLWEVENILKKHKNITRFTTKDDKLFKQQIEIYKN